MFFFFNKWTNYFVFHLLPILYSILHKMGNICSELKMNYLSVETLHQYNSILAGLCQNKTQWLHCFCSNFSLNLHFLFHICNNWKSPFWDGEVLFSVVFFEPNPWNGITQNSQVFLRWEHALFWLQNKSKTNKTVALCIPKSNICLSSRRKKC